MAEPGPNAEARIADLESRLTLADHAIGELSDEMYRQQQKLNQLELLIRSLADQLRKLDAVQPDRQAGDEIPPHY